MSSQVEKVFKYEILMRKVGFCLLSLLFLVVFQSKPLINIFSGLSLLLSLFYIYFYDRNIIKNNRYLLLLIVPYLFGLFLSVFSDAGGEAVLTFILRFNTMLLLIPLTVFIKTKKQLRILFYLLFSSGVIAILYGIYEGQGYSSFQGFHKIGRTADMMLFLSLICLTFLFCSISKNNKKNIFTYLLGTIVFTSAIIMSEMRGTWLGLVVGFVLILIYLMFSGRKTIVLSVVSLILICSSFIYTTHLSSNLDRIKNQVASVTQTKNNESNEARIHLWKTGWDFSQDHLLFGTGVKKSKESFIDFFKSQPQEYQSQFHYALNYPGDFHNSYMQIYIESGALYFILYMIGHGYLLILIMVNIRHVKDENKKLIVVIIISSLSFMFVQIFHNELYSYGARIFYLMIFTGCFLLKNKNSLGLKNKGVENES